jgi:hypothetical protein
MTDSIGTIAISSLVIWGGALVIGCVIGFLLRWLIIPHFPTILSKKTIWLALVGAVSLVAFSEFWSLWRAGYSWFVLALWFLAGLGVAFSLRFAYSMAKRKTTGKLLLLFVVGILLVSGVKYAAPRYSANEVKAVMSFDFKRAGASVTEGFDLTPLNESSLNVRL